ncbi:MAG: hypothetical protein U5J83_14725 [Bryobacterales bacterium]|nr:hypothetical protein [Bryobacterales bacterium]
MATQDSLNETLHRAAKRRFLVVLVSAMGAAFAMVAALFCLLLLAGAQVLSAAPILLLALAGLAFIVWRLRREWLNAYQTAQALDRRFSLPDTISTAWHFEHVETEDSPRLQRLKPLIARQRQDAADALGQVSISDAFPFQLGRSHLAALVLLIFAVALFGYRYLSADALNFREQLASLHIPFIDGEDTPPPMTGDEIFKPEADLARSPLADYEPPYDPSRERLDGTYNDMPPVTGVSVGDDMAGQDGESESAESESAANLREQLSQDPRRQPGNQSKDGKSREGEQRKGEEKGNSLFDKFQQAMNNMIDKLANRDNENMEQRGEQGKNENAKKKGDQAGDGSDDSSDREGNQKSENAQANENSKQGQGGQNAQEVNKQANAAASEKATDAPASVGAEDGNKDLAAARQIEAMGKIAEILGHRAEQVKGDMKVEVQAQKEQTLNTELRNIRATHRDSGGDLSRDEVPLRLQNYVKEYLKNARAAEAASRGEARN